MHSLEAAKIVQLQPSRVLWGAGKGGNGGVLSVLRKKNLFLPVLWLSSSPSIAELCPERLVEPFMDFFFFLASSQGE